MKFLFSLLIIHKLLAIATSFHLPSSRTTTHRNGIKSLVDSSNSPTIKNVSKRRDSAVQMTLNHEDVTNLLHISDSVAINTLLLGIISTVWIVASVALWRVLLVLGVGYWDELGGFMKLCALGLSFLFSAGIVASPVIIATVLLEGIRFISN